MAKKRRARSQKATSAPAAPTTSTTVSSTNERRRAARAARERKRKLRTYALVGVGALVVGFIVILVGSRMFNQPGELVVTQGNAHVSEQEVAAYEYNSRPPTSGPHLGSILPWGVYDEPVSDGRQIHNLEDGGVGIWYDCPDGCPALVAQLEGLVTELGEEGLILAPYPGMDSTIALTAWNRIDKFDQFDADRITKFVKTFRGIDHHSR